MNFEPAEKMKNFEAGIFQILDEKKKELQHITKCSVGNGLDRSDA